ncbi:MAG TPA: DinB family protein [bacterium]|jgi:uncharacterized damage-inducible protein DinB
MNERETFLETWDREHKTTVKVLRAYPAGKDDIKPAPLCKSAVELAGVFVAEQSGLIGGIVKGQIDWSGFHKPPASIPEVVAKLEADYATVAAGVRGMSEADWNAKMEFPVGPKQMGLVRRGDLLWSMVHDMIHHRGQFSIYLRMAGGKVPSIYGPTADEPWH